ncbi:MAG: glycosyltransferase family 39 protein [Candidatus Moranbacteria bacterium]|nr:glycosyltransferase family 39 protein [Candidatus Moranbacteria bacterium]
MRLAKAFFIAIIQLMKIFGKTYSREIILVGIALLAISFWFAYFSEPTVFTGRDQGSFAETAIQIVKNKSLNFSFPVEKEFFNVYGPGKALNFPGFAYTQGGKLATQFPLGYSLWLAFFYAIFGLKGFAIANALTFFIFALFFYLLARLYLNLYPALTALLLILSSFVFAWIVKFTLSENLALALIWPGLYFFARFYKDEKKRFLSAAIVFFGLFLFVRVEGIIFLLIALGILLARYQKKIFSALGKANAWLISIIGVVYILNIFINRYFYLNLIKNLLKSSLVSANGEQVGLFGEMLNVGQVLLAYGLIIFIVMGIVGIIWTFRQKNKEIIIPFLIIAPTFLYLFNPGISDDHPWMLRRFVFTLIPICIFYTVWFLNRFFQKRIFIFYILSLLLFLTNLSVSIPYFGFIPHRRLLQQIETLSYNFGEKDLILVDQQATGDGWSMLAGPLQFIFNKQAAYFLNPNDLARIDKSRFSGIYFIIPDNNLGMYQQSGLLSQMIPMKDYQINNQVLESENGSVSLPISKTLTVFGKIYKLEN